MKVIFVNGSSHRDGTTMQLVKEMQDVFAAEHIDTEVIQLGNKAMEDCIQCGYCFKHNRCVFNDDEVNHFVEKAKDADGFVFATPVYYAHPRPEPAPIHSDLAAQVGCYLQERDLDIAKYNEKSNDKLYSLDLK